MSIEFKTPENLVIAPGNRRFCRGSTQKRFWLGDNPIATAFYNALSVTLPYGEAFSIESVRAFRRDVREKPAREVQAFINRKPCTVANTPRLRPCNRGIPPVDAAQRRLVSGLSAGWPTKSGHLAKPNIIAAAGLARGKSEAALLLNKGVILALMLQTFAFETL